MYFSPNRDGRRAGAIGSILDANKLQFTGLKKGLNDYLKKFNPSTIAGEKVTNASHLDEKKFYFEDGCLLFRVYAEANSRKKVAGLIKKAGASS